MKPSSFLINYCVKSTSKLLVLFLLIVSTFSAAQSKVIKDTTDVKEDTLGKKNAKEQAVLNDFITKMSLEGLKNGQLNLNSNRAVQWQNTNFNLINSEIQKANFILKEGIDYQKFTTELDILIKLKDEALEGIITKRDKKQTVRNLSTTFLLLQEL